MVVAAVVVVAVLVVVGGAAATVADVVAGDIPTGESSSYQSEIITATATTTIDILCNVG